MCSVWYFLVFAILFVISSRDFLWFILIDRTITKTDVTTHLEKLGSLKNFFKGALNLGPSQRTEFFFQSALISAILTHFVKISKIKFCIGSLYFSFFQRQLLILKTNQSLQMLNVLSTILLIVRSFVKVVKLYRWDKSCLYHANSNNFCIDFVSIFLPHFIQAILFYLFQIFLDICQDKCVVFIILSEKLFLV